MDTRELFKRRVIELIHGLPYDEAIDIEREMFLEYRGIQDPFIRLGSIKETLPITIGRVMKALTSINDGNKYHLYENLISFEIRKKCSIYYDFVNRKLTNEDGTECTDDDQTDETIEKLYNLIK